MNDFSEVYELEGLFFVGTGRGAEFIGGVNDDGGIDDVPMSIIRAKSIKEYRKAVDRFVKRSGKALDTSDPDERQMRWGRGQSYGFAHGRVMTIENGRLVPALTVRRMMDQDTRYDLNVNRPKTSDAPEDMGSYITRSLFWGAGFTVAAIAASRLIRSR